MPGRDRRGRPRLGHPARLRQDLDPPQDSRPSPSRGRRDGTDRELATAACSHPSSLIPRTVTSRGCTRHSRPSVLPATSQRTPTWQRWQRNGDTCCTPRMPTSHGSQVCDGSTPAPNGNHGCMRRSCARSHRSERNRSWLRESNVPMDGVFAPATGATARHLPGSLRWASFRG